MATFQDRASVTRDPAFRGRVRVAATLTALATQGEAQGTLGQSAWRKRQRLATDVLRITRDNDPVLESLVWAVAVQVSDPLAPTDDAEIQTIVQASWNDVAGVQADDT
jgi:hypothetical protein